MLNLRNASGFAGLTLIAGLSGALMLEQCSNKEAASENIELHSDIQDTQSEVLQEIESVFAPADQLE